MYWSVSCKSLSSDELVSRGLILRFGELELEQADGGLGPV